MSRFRKFVNQIAMAGVLMAAIVLSGCARNNEARAEANSELAELRTEVAKLKERQEIHDVYIRYGRGIDRLDEQLYRSAFWPDAQINYGTEIIDPDQHWKKHMIGWHQKTLAGWGHLLTNEAVDVDGDVAHVETYVTPMWVPKEKTGTRVLVSGRYIDRLERRNGEWRIAVREFIPHFAMKVDASKDDMWDLWTAKFSKSRCGREPWGKRDTSYVRPLPRRTDKDLGPPCASE